MARSSGSDDNDSYQTMSPTLRRLADICVEAARKSLVILQGLRKQGIIRMRLLGSILLVIQ